MDQQRLAQGTLLFTGIGAVTSGVSFLSNGKFTNGLILVVVGAAIVYWREMNKNTI